MPASPKKVNGLAALIDREATYLYRGFKWLKSDQPTLANRLGWGVRTLQTTIKDSEFETLCTKIDSKKVTLIRRAIDCKDSALNCKSNSVIPQLQFRNSATPQLQFRNSATPQSNFAMLNCAKPDHEVDAVRKNLVFEWCSRTGDNPRKLARKYGQLRGLAQQLPAGKEHAIFAYVLDNWAQFKKLVEGVTGEDWKQDYPSLGTFLSFSWRAVELYEAVQAEKQMIIDKYESEL